ncbi:CARDB domain-containing protein [Wukongibacter baidiensis]|uniref:CARDB domain-containing protein n=1 Tax=Wukongibacter baidiensis TaxID=1723361 RepID=UPI003D7FA957
MARADLKILKVEPSSLRAYKDSQFKVTIDNVGDVKSSPFTLAVYDEYGKRLDYHYNRSGLHTYGYNKVTLEFRIKESGRHTLRFVIEAGDILSIVAIQKSDGLEFNIRIVSKDAAGNTFWKTNESYMYKYYNF